jgi:xanthine/uracil/vitamin C permease (AzgA family)
VVEVHQALDEVKTLEMLSRKAGITKVASRKDATHVTLVTLLIPLCGITFLNSTLMTFVDSAAVFSEGRDWIT